MSSWTSGGRASVSQAKHTGRLGVRHEQVLVERKGSAKGNTRQELDGLHALIRLLRRGRHMLRGSAFRAGR
jgi:hypothetical protein